MADRFFTCSSRRTSESVPSFWEGRERATVDVTGLVFYTVGSLSLFIFLPVWLRLTLALLRLSKPVGRYAFALAIHSTFHTGRCKFSVVLSLSLVLPSSVHSSIYLMTRGFTGSSAIVLKAIHRFQSSGLAFLRC